MLIGLHRISPIKLDKAFWIQNGPLLLMLAAAGYFFRQAHLEHGLINWAGASVGLATRFVPLMILLVLVMSIGQVLMKVYEKPIEGFLMNNQTLAPLAGTFAMPSPNSAAPLIEKLWANKALQPMFLYFLQAASLASVPLFMLRQMGIRNPEIANKMYITGFIMAMVTFPLRVPLCRLTEWIYSLW